LLIGALVGCLHPTAGDPSLRAHLVEIRDEISPQDLYVNVGDEIRWHNLRAEPVKIGLLNHPQLNLVSCERGFSRFGQVQDTATIPAQEYVSLCFSKPGIVEYNVWMNLDDPYRSMTPTAKIQVFAMPTVRK
jgi:hypothetical protein